MAIVKTISVLSPSGSLEIPIFGFAGGFFVNASRFQRMNLEELWGVLTEQSGILSHKERYLLYRRLMDFSYDLKEDEFQFIEYNLGFVNGDGSPKRCWSCGGENFRTSFHSDNRIEVERNVTCNDCKKDVGHWSYGNWMT